MFCTQCHHILQGHDSHICGRGEGQTDEVPCHIGTVYVQVTAVVVFFRFGCGFVPAFCGVVIVGACIYHSVSVIGMGQVGIVFIFPESELQDTHAGQACKFTQFQHFFCNGAQIFCDQGQVITQHFLQFCKEGFAGSFHPFAADGIFCTEGNFPIGFKAAEVVDTQDIHVAQGFCDTADPPCKFCFFMLFPVIERVAPQLAGFAEIIGGNTCDAQREAFAVQTEQLLVCPYVSTVIGYEDRCVADDGDAFFVGIGFHCLPLFLEDILQEDFLFNGIGKDFSPFFQHHGIAFFGCFGEGYPVGADIVILHLFFCQFQPFTFCHESIEVFCGFFVGTLCAEVVFQGNVQDIVIQPESIFFAEFCVVCRLFHGFECLICFFQQGQFCLFCFLIVYAGFGFYIRRLQVFHFQIAVFHQFFGADEEGIARKGGTAGIGRTAVVRGNQRQYLPQGLAGFCQFIDKCVCCGAKIACTVVGGQGCGVQQHAASSFCHEKHSFYKNDKKSLGFLNIQYTKNFKEPQDFRWGIFRHDLWKSAIFWRKCQ